METEVSDDGVHLIKIKDQNNELASSGRVVCLDNWAIMTELKPVSITKEKDWEVTCLGELQKQRIKKELKIISWLLQKRGGYYTNFRLESGKPIYFCCNYSLKHLIKLNFALSK